MTAKPSKSFPENSSDAKRKTGSDDSADHAVTKDAPRPVREGKENLRQRAEWFRNRTGGEK